MGIKLNLERVLCVAVCLLIIQILLGLHLGEMQHHSSIYGLFEAKPFFNFTNKTIISQVTIKTTNGTKWDETSMKLAVYEGFALAESVREICKSIKDSPLGKFFTLFGFVDKGILYCPVEKCATTFWRRTFYLLTNKNIQSQYTNPFAVPLSVLPTVNREFTVKTSYMRLPKEIQNRENSFKFLFIRNPYSRVYSAFVDKLLPPDPYFWKLLGARAIAQFRKQPSYLSKSTGYDVTFAEYFKFVIRSLQTKLYLDEHHISIFDKCEPCTVEFDYIGKMESFPDDSMFILKKLGLNSTVETFTGPEVFKDMSAEDAVMDTTTTPFAWKSSIIRIISWETALRRIWLKLQLRGLVDMDQTFDKYVPKSKINALTGKEFEAVAQEARKISDPVKLKAQKSEGMREAYLTLHIDDVRLLRSLYRNDFRLFGYEESPHELFERPDEAQIASKYFTYLK